MTFPEISYTPEQMERMKACWDAFDDVPLKAIKQIRVKDLIAVIKSVRETLGCAAVHAAIITKEASHGE
jgi:hypothetical protein